MATVDYCMPAGNFMDYHNICHKRANGVWGWCDFINSGEPYRCRGYFSAFNAGFRCGLYLWDVFACMQKGESTYSPSLCSHALFGISTHNRRSITALKNRKNAYMTVEASLVMAVVLMVYLFIIQYALWCYDRFMLEQDLAMMLLRCSNAEETEVIWQREKRAWEEKEYLWTKDKKVTLEKGLVTLKIVGEAKGQGMGNISAGYEMWDLSPQQWLRGKEKLNR